MADWTVDPGGTGDYLTLNAWNTAEATDITSDASKVCECTTSNGNADTTLCDMSAFDWTLDATHTLTIQAAEGHEAQKDEWDTTIYRLDTTDTNALNVDSASGYITVDGLQIRANYSSETSLNSLEIGTTTADTGPITIKNCRVEGTNNDGIGRGIYSFDDDTTLVIENCIVCNVDRYLVLLNGFSDAKIYNCTLAHQDYGTGDGVYITSAGTCKIRNCIIYDTADDIDDSNSSDIDYCGAEDDLNTELSVTNCVQPSNWANELEDAANDDFTLLTGGDLEGEGVGPDTDGDVPETDIDGTTRSGNSCDIGADEYAAGGTPGLSIPVAMHHYMNNIGAR